MHAMTMTGLHAPLEWTHRCDPTPRRDQVRVKVSACGLCRTDLHVVDSELPDPVVSIVPGHEIVGRANEALDDSPHIRPTDLGGQLMTTSHTTLHTVDGALRLVDGFAADERAGIVAVFGRLDTRLQSFTHGTVELLLTVKDRDAPGQRMTLEARIAGVESVIATSERSDIGSALRQVRDEVVRQITDAKDRTEARNNRHLRVSGTEKHAGDE